MSGTGEPAEYTVLVVFASEVLDRFALARHRDRGWELPGGRIEPGESWLEAGKREWAEETGRKLAHLEPLVLHHRPDGSRGHVCLGRVEGGGDADADAEPEPITSVPDEKIEEVRWVRRLAEVSPLAFPDDPYGKLARAVLGRRRGGGWRLPEGESEAVFVQRLAVHPDAAPAAHRIVPHPAATP